MADMILTSECENCLHSEIDERNKAKVMIYCRQKDKWYIYGQCIPCSYKEVRKNDSKTKSL